ncbi:MAG: hypothetical protein ACFCVK_24435 [Acidimicrobiales bacterium]
MATDIAFAWSDDGLEWGLHDGPPALDRDRAIQLLAPLEPHRSLERELWRVYDPRLTVVDWQ